MIASGNLPRIYLSEMPLYYSVSVTFGEVINQGGNNYLYVPAHVFSLMIYRFARQLLAWDLSLCFRKSLLDLTGSSPKVLNC